MKAFILSKLFHIGIFLIFGMTFYSILENANDAIAAGLALIGFIIMMAGAYRNGFKLD